MKRIVCGVLLAVMASCASDKLNISPLPSKVSTKNNSVKNIENIGAYISQNEDAAEITNLIASFPKFPKNNLLNQEISLMKLSLQDYLYAVEIGNEGGKVKALKNFENSYKKIQKLRKKLSPEEDELINRYLVRIKTNLNSIEYYLNTPVNN